MSQSNDQNSVIEFTEVTKTFTSLSAPPTTLKTHLVNLLRGKLPKKKSETFTALKDISFNIRSGEFIGIMGRNGAGKSTLLKLVSGIYQPSSGSINIKGAIAPLIELGAGFNLELTGFENIFLNAAVLGFGKKVTEAAIPKILEFAELGDHIHAPVRHYSSGMLVRLGFSIATNLDAPILLIDEILAVGDLAFQNKCLEKIRELHQHQGRTIVLITHNPAAVRDHCSRCLVIDKHHVVFDGNPNEGASRYEELC